ncbi:MAG: TPM domain-containing protein [Clostridiales bacterium]|nr:TPM domain-containing protein [Clostridiales bacterium]
MKKQVLSMITAFSLMLGLAACGNSATQAPAPSPVNEGILPTMSSEAMPTTAGYDEMPVNSLPGIISGDMADTLSDEAVSAINQANEKYHSKVEGQIFVIVEENIPDGSESIDAHVLNLASAIDPAQQGTSLLLYFTVNGRVLLWHGDTLMIEPSYVLDTYFLLDFNTGNYNAALETLMPRLGENTYLNGETTPIVIPAPKFIACQPFSIERAWVSYSYENETRTGLIDTAGKLLGSFSGEAHYAAPFTDNYTFIIHEADADYCSFSIVDMDGNVAFQSDSYMILGYGGGHFLAAQHISDFSTNEWRLGTLDAHGNVINEFKTYYTFRRNDKVQDAVDGVYGYGADFTYNGSYLKRCEYLGEGIFSLGRYNGYLYSISQNELYSPNPNITLVGAFYDGFTLGATAELLPANYAGEDLQKIQGVNSVPLFDSTRNDAYYLNLYNEGLFFGHVQGGLHGVSKDGYFNIHGECVLEFPQLNERPFTGGPFSNGYAVLRIIGADKGVYITAIDKSGTMQYEPMKVEAFNVLESCNGYAWVTIDGRGFIVDPQGNQYTAGIDDLSNMGNDAQLFSGKGYPHLSGGFFIIGNTYVSLDAQTILSEVDMDE